MGRICRLTAEVRAGQLCQNFLGFKQPSPKAKEPSRQTGWALFLTNERYKALEVKLHTELYIAG
jgi:hypothetical protein